jgi:hypothetical protein
MIFECFSIWPPVDFIGGGREPPAVLQSWATVSQVRVGELFEEFSVVEWRSWKHTPYVNFFSKTVCKAPTYSFFINKRLEYVKG